MHDDIQKILLTSEQIAARVAELGQTLAQEYARKDPVFIGVLKGVVVFFADIVRATPIPCQFDFMAVSSYDGTATTGHLQMKKDVSVEIKGRHDPVIMPRAVVVVESMAAITLVDRLFVGMTARMDKIREFYKGE